MADDPKIPNEEQILKQLKESGSPPTRKTLIEKLDNWDDWASWDEFYRTYSSFVFHVARKAGLSEDEAGAGVQETFTGVAKKLQHKQSHTRPGPTKLYLLNHARPRIRSLVHTRKA